MIDALRAPGRPLWRRIVDFPLVTLVLVLLAVTVPMRLVAELTAATLGPGGGWTVPLLRGVVQPLVAILLYRAVSRRIGIDRHDALPLGRPALDALRGVGIAFVLMSAIVGIAALLGGYRIDGWGGLTTWRDLLFVAGLSAGVIEEVIARGILLRYLEDLAGTWFALAASSALFGAAHLLNPHATWFSALAIGLEAGVMLGGAYLLTRNLWLAIGLHAGWNVTQGFIWDVPVSGVTTDGLVTARTAGPELISGGAFGLEASVVALAVAGAFGIALVTMAVRRGRLRAPLWRRTR